MTCWKNPWVKRLVPRRTGAPAGIGHLPKKVVGRRWHSRGGAEEDDGAGRRDRAAGMGHQGQGFEAITPRHGYDIETLATAAKQKMTNTAMKYLKQFAFSLSPFAESGRGENQGLLEKAAPVPTDNLGISTL